jgi:DNA-binding NarL/FixJ family response regulator
MVRIGLLLSSHFVLLREGLRALLANHPRIEVIAQSASAAETEARIREFGPSVVLLHLSQDDEEGFKTIEGLLSGPAIRIIALTGNSEHDFIVRLLRAGVRGYLSDQETEAELITAVEAVARGEVYLSPSANKAILNSDLEQSQPN